MWSDWRPHYARTGNNGYKSQRKLVANTAFVAAFDLKALNSQRTPAYEEAYPNLFAAMTKGKKKSAVELNLDNIERLEHLMPVPKSRSSSITSIESEDGSMMSVLKPPPLKDFDDLVAFESYIRDETWDNDFDYCHARLSYYPPFILKEVHGNLDKIKPTMNKNSRKFRRNLQHHIKRHLMQDMEKCLGFRMDFGKAKVEETPKSITWKFVDEGDHGFAPEEEDLYERHWKCELLVKCNNENPMVEVDYKAIPV